MTSNNPFLNWLDSVQCKSGLVNSYYYVCLAENFNGGRDPRRDFLVPDFNILDEIERENNERTPSLKLRKYLIDSLKRVQPDRDIQINNYMKVLRDFVASLYSGKIETNRREAERNVPPQKQFHELRGEVKLWIFHSLLQYTSRGIRQPKPIGRDSYGNMYFIVNKTMLYVQYGTKLQEMTRADLDKKWNSLERRIFSMPQWKLLADSEDLWTQKSLLLESFDEDEIANRINEEIGTAVSINKVSSQEEHKVFEEKESNADNFHRTIPMRRSRTQLKKPPSVRWTDDERRPSHSPTHRSPSIQRRESEGSSIDSFSQNNQPFLRPGERSKTIRCMYYPNCKRSSEECHFVHPQYKCNNFGRSNCPGVVCRFIHPTCENDGHCMNNNCTFEHVKTMPSLRRIHYAKMKESNESSREREESNRFTTGRDQSVEGVRESFEDNLNISGHNNFNRGSSPLIRSRESERTIISPIHNERPFSNKDLRCHYFPRCNKPADRCVYAHPRDHCPSFPNCVRGRDCPLLHGPCPSDRDCINEHCPFEHYQQIPPRASVTYHRNAQRNNQY